MSGSAAIRLQKVVIASSHDRPLDVMHSLWEPENAEGFRDEYYDIPFDASHIISIATANSVDGIAPSLLDRLLILDIKPPTFGQRRSIALQAYGAAVVKAGGIAYATHKMNDYKKEALDILHQFPESPVRQGLEDMVLFVTDRKY